MDPMKDFHGLQLDQHLVSHQEIDPMPPDVFSFIVQADFLLPDKRDLSQGKLMGHGFLIDVLQKAGPQLGMDFHRAGDDFLGEFLGERVSRSFG